MTVLCHPGLGRGVSDTVFWAHSLQVNSRSLLLSSRNGVSLQGSPYQTGRREDGAVLASQCECPLFTRQQEIFN